MLILATLSTAVSLAATRDVASAKGHAVFDTWCAMCHAPGDTYAGTVGLQIKYAGKLPGALEKRADLSGELIRRAVRRGAGIMPAFRKTEVSDAELAQLVAYLAPARP